MFTGLIQETGSVLSVESRRGVHHIAIHAPALASQLHVGDSIAVSGVCLTAFGMSPEGHPDRFEADLAEETVRRTSLSQLAPGAMVNLELPTPAGTPLGGPCGAGSRRRRGPPALAQTRRRRKRRDGLVARN